ncbi:MAG: sulfur carrier protein ThiS [Clostridia bacterium]|nr:sulfur carrier protein ThiS [Clostridia bacterium]
MVKINGEQLGIDGYSMTEYLLSAGYDIKRVAVELNGNILPKADYDETLLKDGDSLEVVSFVGGG